MSDITFQAMTSNNLWGGSIIPIQLQKQPYEIEVNARGSCFHILIGTHVYGNFICVPNWDVGTELSSLSDLFWNKERLYQKTKLKKVDACSIAYALQELSKHISL